MVWLRSTSGDAAAAGGAAIPRLPLCGSATISSPRSSTRATMPSPRWRTKRCPISDSERSAVGTSSRKRSADIPPPFAKRTSASKTARYSVILRAWQIAPGRSRKRRTHPGCGVRSVSWSGRRSAGDACRAASRELVLRVRGLGVELDEAGLDLAEHLADGDAEDALAAAHEVDDLVVGGAEVDARAVAHQGRLGEVADAGLTELVDRGADLLQRDAGVEEPLDELEDQDVAEAVEALRAGAGRTADRGLDEPRAGPVVELPVADAGRAGGDGAAEAFVVFEVRHAVREEQPKIVTIFAVAEFLHQACLPFILRTSPRYR